MRAKPHLDDRFFRYAGFVVAFSVTLYVYIMLRGAPVFPLSIVFPACLSLIFLHRLKYITASPLVIIYCAYLAWPLLTFPAGVILVYETFGPGFQSYQLVSLAYFYLCAAPLVIGYFLGRRRGDEISSLTAGFKAGLLTNILFVLLVFAYNFPDLYLARAVIKQRLPLIICYLSTVVLVLSAVRPSASRLLPITGLLTVVLSLSRASLLQLIVSLAILSTCFPNTLLLTGWRHKKYILLVSVAVFVIGITSPRVSSTLDLVVERFAALTDPANLGTEDHSASVRIDIWRALGHEMLLRPLSLLIGFGQLGPSYVGPTFVTLDGDVIERYSAHNQYLDTLFRGGVGGLVLEGVLYVAVVIYAIFGKYENLQQKWFGRAHGLALMGVLAFGMFHETLRWSLFGGLFWLFAGWLAGATEAFRGFRLKGASC